MSSSNCFDAARIHGFLSDFLQNLTDYWAKDKITHDFIQVIHMQYLRQIFNILAEFQMLNPELRDSITAHKNHFRLLKLLLWLKKNTLLTVENLNLALEHPEPRSLDLMLLELDEIEILPQASFVLVAKHPKPIALMEAIQQLIHSTRLTQEIFSFVATHPEPAIARAIIILPKEALTPRNLELLGSHRNFMNLACAFKELIAMYRFTDACRDLVYNHQNPHAVTLVFYYLHQAGIATQENLEYLTADNHKSLMINFALQRLWPSIPTHQLTQANFERLLVAAEQPNPEEWLTEVRNQILNNIPQAGAGHVAYLNPIQSTHTASVHRAVSVSAAKLMSAYGDGLDLDETIDAIKTFINGLDDSPKHQAAKRCIKRITKAGYTFTDTSEVSIRQLLALAYTAIHDDKKRWGFLQDAKDCFVEGLYEIQRGYNIDRGQGPEEGDDVPICSAGTFNKIMEKLKGIHQDVEIEYITHEGASLKFPRIANASANDYLQALAAPKTAEEYLNLKDLLERLKVDKTLEFIWENIKEVVEKQLWDEFKSAYAKQDDVRFLALMNNGQYLPLPDLTAVETMLIASPGYQAYLDEQAGLSLVEQRLFLGFERNQLWSFRQSSTKAQQDFDVRYGLVLKS